VVEEDGKPRKMNAMKNKIAWIPWGLCAIVIVGALFSWVLALNDPKTYADIFVFINAGLNALFDIAFGVVGALILSRQTRNRIGELLMFIGLSLAVAGSLQNYLAQILNGTAEPSTLTYLLIWLDGWTWWLLVGPLLLLLLVFPTGQVLSPRWRWVVGIIGLLFSVFIVFATFSPSLQDPNTGKIVPNPLGMNLLPADFSFETIVVPWIFTLTSTVALSVLGVFIRYRRSALVEREQIKWFLYACALLIAVYVSQAFTHGNGPSWLGVISSITFLLLPISIGISILRYHLFDIDIIIRRTLIYSIITAMLALFYFGSVVVLQQILRPLIGAESDLAIILSTLAIAALFNPLRHRVQDTIDHRFYRRKYDAQKVLARFAQTVRDEVELEKLTGELLRVVDETMQPTRVSLWLKNRGQKAKQ
jgi:hypothetical protein